MDSNNSRHCPQDSNYFTLTKQHRYFGWLMCGIIFDDELCAFDPLGFSRSRSDH